MEDSSRSGCSSLKASESFRPSSSLIAVAVSLLTLLPEMAIRSVFPATPAAFPKAVRVTPACSMAAPMSILLVYFRSARIPVSSRFL